jgi:RNA polymerase sigma-70 factor, ECF subfamily
MEREADPGTRPAATVAIMIGSPVRDAAGWAWPDALQIPGIARQRRRRRSPGQPSLPLPVTAAALVRIACSVIEVQCVPGRRLVPMDNSGGSGVGEACPQSLADQAMESYADGDDAAFSALYDELAPRLFRFAARQLQNRAAAEDVVQQTLLQIHCARDRFTRGAAVLPWAYAIARRLVIDVSRRRGREDLRANPLRGAEEPSGAAAPDEALHRKRSEAALRADLLRLPAALRESFDLLKVEGLSVAECAEVLGITRGMVKIRAHRATAALRRAEMRRERAAPTVFKRDPRQAREGEPPT